MNEYLEILVFYEVNFFNLHLILEIESNLVEKMLLYVCAFFTNKITTSK